MRRLGEMLIDGLCKSYDGKDILKSINWSEEDGGIYCIMGESGVGKTTLLRILMGLEGADCGTVSGFGRVSAVFQESYLVRNRSAVWNVKLTCPRLSTSYIRDELCKVLPEDCVDMPIDRLSGGMKRRVAIVRAMLSDCDTICMDEPFTGLDETNKSVVYDYIKQMAGGRSLIIVTHDEKEALALSKRIYLLTSEGLLATIKRTCE